MIFGMFACGSKYPNVRYNLPNKHQRYFMLDLAPKAEFSGMRYLPQTISTIQNVETLDTYPVFGYFCSMLRPT